MGNHPAPEQIEHLCSLLSIPPLDRPASPALTLEHLRAWKPRAEALARQRTPQAEAVAQLFLLITTHHADKELGALAGWIAGNVYHDLDLMPAANAAYTQSYTLYQNLGETLNAARMSIGWIHVLSELAAYDQAVTLADQAKIILAASPLAEDQRRLAILYGNQGIVYEQMGRLVEALASYEYKWNYYHTQAATATHKDLYTILDEALILNDIAIVQTLLGQYQEAERTFAQALAQLTPYEGEPLTWVDLARVRMNRAWLATIRSAMPGIVSKLLHEAYESRARLQTSQEQSNFIFLDLLEVQWQLRLGQWQAVDADRLAALETVTAASGVAAETALARLLAGQHALAQGQAQAAIAKFTQVQAEAIANSPGVAYLAGLWHARALRHLQMDQAVEQKLKETIRLIEQTRQHLTTAEYRAGYLDDKLVAYQDLTELYLAQQQWLAALAVTEQSKARTLTEAVSPQPTVFVDQAAQPSSITEVLAALATHLPADTLLISYTVLHQQVWAFLLTSQGLIAPPQPIADLLTRTELDSGLRRLQQIRLLPTLDQAAIQTQISHVQKPLGVWFERFLAPLRPWLTQFRTVFISPDGLLNALPFACLFDQQSGRYFVETHAVAIIPSLTLWSSLAASQAARPRPNPHKALILGNSTKDGLSGQLPRTVDEACSVADQFTAPTLLLEREATCQRFLTEAAQATLIHLAAHGEYRMGEPSASFIELADRPLQVREILQLRLPGSIVVLSACETSKGHLSGNEMLGLVRAFLAAGAHTVVATHWPIDDEATFALMTNFVQTFSQSGSLAQALAQAQRHFLLDKYARLAHPFFWGAPAIFGLDRR